MSGPLANDIALVDAYIRLGLWIALIARASNALIHAADDPTVCRTVVRQIRRRTAGWNTVGWLFAATLVASITSGRPAAGTSLIYDVLATLATGVLVGAVAWPALRVDGRRDDPNPQEEEAST